jgi:hypothetical protein
LLTDPISLEPIRLPIILSSGLIYDLQSIVTWSQVKAVDPTTSQQFTEYDKDLLNYCSKIRDLFKNTSILIREEIETNSFKLFSSEALITITQEEQFLFNLVKTKNAHELKRYLDQYNELNDLEIKDSQGGTLLSLAVKNGDQETVGLLLARGANPDTLTNKDDYALIQAAGYGHFEIVKQLIVHGADVSVSSRLEGNVAMATISFLLNTDPPVDEQILIDRMEFFSDHKVKIDAKNPAGMTILTLAIMSEKFKLADKLIEKGLSMEDKLTFAKIE